MIPKLSKNDLLQYKPQVDWFARNPLGSIHGIAHESRVLILVQVLARMVEHELHIPLNRKALALAAAVHDVRRMNENEDPEHGMRAKKWINTPNSKGYQYVGEHRDLVSYLCEFHVCHDLKAPKLHTLEAYANLKHLWVFKDADALDRVRIYDVCTDMLRTDAAFQLIGWAWELHAESIDAHMHEDAFERVIEAAERIGLVT